MSWKFKITGIMAAWGLCLPPQLEPISWQKLWCSLHVTCPPSQNPDNPSKKLNTVANCDQGLCKLSSYSSHLPNYQQMKNLPAPHRGLEQQQKGVKWIHVGNWRYCVHAQWPFLPVALPWKYVGTLEDNLGKTSFNWRIVKQSMITQDYKTQMYKHNISLFKKN